MVADSVALNVEEHKFKKSVKQRCAQQQIEMEGGESGVSLSDILSGVATFFESAAQGLTPLNCRSHLDDLPQDMDVVRVDPIVRKVKQPHRYINAA